MLNGEGREIDALQAAHMACTSFQPALPTLYIAEGLLMYLRSEEMSALFQTVARVSASDSSFCFHLHRIAESAHPRPSTPVQELAALDRPVYVLAMPLYSYKRSELKVNGNTLVAASICQDGTEHLRMARFEGPPNDFPGLSVYGEACRELTRLGANAVREVRQLLKAGPTNNKMFEGEFIFGADPVMANSLNKVVEGCWQELKDNKPETARYRPLWDAAAYAASCRAALGGVCAAISWVTMGVISQRASNTLACVYYNAGADHSYVLIRKRETPWFVVDPWVREPRLCPWRYNYFGASEGNTHYFDITHPVEVALGQPIDDALLEKSFKKAQLVGYQVPHKRKIWSHTTNVKPEHASVYPAVCTAEEWGPMVATEFRVESLWA